MKRTKKPLNLPSWLEATNDGRWRLTQNLTFQTDKGEIMVPRGFVTDLFTDVPDTGYPDFWKASILHDYLLVRLHGGNPALGYETRPKCDDAFYCEMIVQSMNIFNMLREVAGTRSSIRTFVRLIKVSEVYYYGVSTYGWFWRLFH